MAKKNRNALTNDDLLAICVSEIDNATTIGGDLAQERADALDYYMGEKYGDEAEGRSQVITREVMETVEWVLPSLMRIFTDSENCVVFEPVGPEDVPQAKVETAVVNHVYWKQNRGFYNTYAFCKDALLSKTGILKIYWEKYESVERESYAGLSDVQLGMLMADEDVEREVLEYELMPEGHNVTFRATSKKGKICIEPVPPEEFGISRDARSPYVSDSDFCYHRTRKSFAEWVEAGFYAKKLREIPTDDDVDTQERRARRTLNDEIAEGNSHTDESMRQIWVTECYVRVDKNGDNIAELVKVSLGAGSTGTAGAKLLSVEEVDCMPFAAVTPVLLTHKFYGMSLADLTMDLQKIKSTLVRQVLDNVYLANNGRTAVNDKRVNLDDLLVSRPGGVVRYNGDQPASAYITPIPHNPLPPESFTLLEYLDEVRKQRTGVGDEVAGLDKGALASISPSVAAIAMDSARMKIELIARIMAEVGLRTAFGIVHELLSKHQDRAMTQQIAGQWVEVNPSEWRTRQNLSVQVGVGNASRERRLMALENIIGRQAEQVQAGGMGVVLQPHNVYQALADWTEAWGMQATQYWSDPRMMPPPQPKPDVQSDAMMLQAQAVMRDAESKIQRVQLDTARAQAEVQLKLREHDLKQQEQELKAEMSQLQAHLSAMKSEADAETKVASIELAMQKQDTEQQLQRLALELDHVKSERDRELNAYKTQLDNITKLLIAQGQIEATADAAEMAAGETETPEPAEPPEPEGPNMMEQILGQLIAQNQMMAEAVMSMRSADSRPKRIKRDAAGLIVEIG